MIQKFALRTDEGVWYSLAEMNVLADKPEKATVWDTQKEAQYWLENHTIWFHKLTKIGFKVVRVER